MRNLGVIQVTLESIESGPVQPPATNSFYRKNKLLVELLPHQDNFEQKTQSIAQARVIHYECISWSDHGTPELVEPILELISSAKADSMISSPEDSTPRTSPILVHCSAGVGRSGTLIAIASCTAQLALLNSYNLSERMLKANIISHLILPRLVPENGRIAQLPEWLNDDLVARTVDFLREQRVSTCFTCWLQQFSPPPRDFSGVVDLSFAPQLALTSGSSLLSSQVLMVQTIGQLDYVYKAVACFAASLS
jgi:protein tyrosine phosphatase